MYLDECETSIQCRFETDGIHTYKIVRSDKAQVLYDKYPSGKA